MSSEESSILHRATIVLARRALGLRLLILYPDYCESSQNVEVTVSYDIRSETATNRGRGGKGSDTYHSKRMRCNSKSIHHFCFDF